MLLWKEDVLDAVIAVGLYVTNLNLNLNLKGILCQYVSDQDATMSTQ